MQANDATCIFVHSRTRQRIGSFALFYNVWGEIEVEKVLN